MLTIGDRFPAFKLKAAVSLEKGKEFQDISGDEQPGKWKVVFFWPKDFTFICPTEIAAFGKRNRDFADRDARVLGVSTDNEYVHLAWRKSHPDLKDLPFPMLSDLKHDLVTALGIKHPTEGVAMRATFIVDPDNVIRFVSVTDLDVGRNVDEVLRVLDALQTDELCPCNWQKGDPTLNAEPSKGSAPPAMSGGGQSPPSLDALNAEPSKGSAPPAMSGGGQSPPSLDALNAEPSKGSAPPAMSGGGQSPPSLDALNAEPSKGSAPPAMSGGGQSPPSLDALNAEPSKGSAPPAMSGGGQSPPSLDALNAEPSEAA